MPVDGTIRVLLVEPHPLLRHGLRANLEAEVGFAIVGEATSGDEASAEIERLLPDVVLLDLTLIERDGGSALIGALLRRSPASRIVVLSALEGERPIREALAAGAHLHLRKDAFREELVAAVRALSNVVLESPGPSLSDREIDVLRLVARGRSNGEIAAALLISEGTVKSHLQRIFVKMGVDDRTEAAIAALKQGAIRL